MSNKYKIINIYGVTRYVYLSAPDTQFDKEGVYHLTLEVDKDKAQDAKKAIDGVISKEIAEEHKARPSTKLLTRGPLQYTDEGNIITFKAKTQYKPLVVDRRNKELDSTIAIWKGTTMWIEVELRGYNKNNRIGCALYLKQVQIDGLVKGTGNGASHFPDRGGGSSSPGPEKAVSL